MNPIIKKTIGSLEMRGLISPSGLPDLLVNYEREEEKITASVLVVESGVLMAVR